MDKGQTVEGKKERNGIHMARKNKENSKMDLRGSRETSSSMSNQKSFQNGNYDNRNRYQTNKMGRDSNNYHQIFYNSHSKDARKINKLISSNNSALSYKQSRYVSSNNFRDSGPQPKTLTNSPKGASDYVAIDHINEVNLTMDHRQKFAEDSSQRKMKSVASQKNKSTKYLREDEFIDYKYNDDKSESSPIRTKP